MFIQQRAQISRKICRKTHRLEFLRNYIIGRFSIVNCTKQTCQVRSFARTFAVFQTADPDDETRRNITIRSLNSVSTKQLIRTLGMPLHAISSHPWFFVPTSGLATTLRFPLEGPRLCTFSVAYRHLCNGICSRRQTYIHTYTARSCFNKLPRVSLGKHRASTHTSDRPTPVRFFFFFLFFFFLFSFFAGRTDSHALFYNFYRASSELTRVFSD